MQLTPNAQPLVKCASLARQSSPFKCLGREFSWRDLVTNKLVQDAVLHYQGNTLVLSIKIIRLHQGPAQQVKFVIARLRQICFLEADYFPGVSVSSFTSEQRCELSHEQ